MQARRHLHSDDISELDRLTLLIIARECEQEWRRLRAEARREDPNRVTDRGIYLRASAAMAKRLRDRFAYRAKQLAEGVK